MRWRREYVVDTRRGSIEDLAFGEEEGESMVGFGDPERLERGRDERGGRVLVGRGEIDSERRLSRDLEEGFKDDSEEEEESERRR
jgi:hypothetical protein